MNLNLTMRSCQRLAHLRLAAAQIIFARTSSKVAVNIDADLLTKLEHEELKPRHHTGILKTKRPELPTFISRAILKVTGDHPVKNILQDCEKLNRYISSRHPPPEKDVVREKIRKIIEEVDSKLLLPPENLSQLTEIEQSQFERKRQSIINRLIGNRIYSWKPIAYGAYEALVYAVGRGPQEYGVLLTIMQEIYARDEKFTPRSYFDFGSGVGTGMWAASTLWKDSIFEYYNVDSSRDMHDISELILKGGFENHVSYLRNVYYRQFLPKIETKYDMVICAFSLFELPNEETRKEVISKLWNICDGYLIVVEEGTRRGSELINETRDHILSLAHEGHVFAPCPHDEACPRLSNTEDVTPCNFEISYTPNRLLKNNRMEVSKTHYSYVVMKKGKSNDNTQQWPRLVRPTLVRSKHVICRMCTLEGNLQEIIFTKSKHGKFPYMCARASRWGDRLPMVIQKNTEENTTKDVKSKIKKNKQMQVTEERQQ